jgi:uracil-DNA glycosylase
MKKAWVSNFEEWRSLARAHIYRGTRPTQLSWGENSPQLSLLKAEAGVCSRERPFPVPKPFLELARKVACHSTPDKWALLYRVLWRIKGNEPELLSNLLDEDVGALTSFAHEVSQDIHHMRSFLEFRKRRDPKSDEWVAHYLPRHKILREVAPHFVKMFSDKKWTIVTPYESARWDTKQLSYHPGVNPKRLPKDDSLAEFWTTYQGSMYKPGEIEFPQGAVKPIQARGKRKTKADSTPSQKSSSSAAQTNREGQHAVV